MVPVIRKKCHDHVDGSSAMLDIVPELYRKYCNSFPFASREAWKIYCRDSSVDLPARFGVVTNILQTRYAIWRAGYNYGKKRAEEGYSHVEGKFAPQYHTRDGLSMKTVVDIMCRGFKDAEHDYGITISPVICIGREADQELGKEIAQIALDLNYDGIVILDLVCVEPGNPPEKHLPAYQMTFGTHVKRDCHAGEWVSTLPVDTYWHRLTRNVRTAIVDLKCHSVGHAIPLGQNDSLLNLALDNNVRIVGCPLSELTLGWIKDVGELNIDYILRRGICYTFDADDDLFLPTTEEVAEACDKVYHFTETQCRQIEANALRVL